MRCAVWTGGREFRIEERPAPEPGPGQVRVRVHACGVCLTDVHAIDGLLRETLPPAVLGHEFGGVVDALGPGVSGLSPGAAVACAARGGFAEQVVLPATGAFPLPAGVPVEESAFVEPILCCNTAVQNAALPMGGTVLLTGAGPMGLLTLQLARRGGASWAVVSEPDPARRALAARLGADAVLDPTQTDVRGAVYDLTAGRGVDAAFECAGRPEPLADCLRSVVREGAVVMVGVNARTAGLDLNLYDFHYRALRLIGSYGGAGRSGFAGATRWLGRLDLAPLISHRCDLDGIAQAFELARAGTGMKVLVGAGLA
jgi:threonine dehydrogenase-like Zn-dependent dehydrogenase